mmetsp:Transcript_35753/g.112911  ORF Transcript_35753/g.112911 Transcript_35753/m.112911 type:complete len:511 (+) Transcript_35753:74-1606(+)|eukprot:CAMPEP_0182913998 /NCGR_PEP_ID=MMETSP0034_2-20130328/38324_1 /TAXON_ID=156128 /ORGANISM="Nephroselmis pyriformis, Strain CCMP717" /LENGTH=510 /DNA_ID=CAMNT_0025050727 /DNA_START=19 /DNA_END=1551 /DNA_ORIENTATION=+
MSPTVRKAALICIDGWGLRSGGPGNAIEEAKTPFMDAMQAKMAFAPLDASGLSVGLPEGIMGNSEVGHLTIGAGQAQYQDLVRINLAFKNGTVATNDTLVAAFDKAKAGNGRVHFLGLLSDGSVHSHQEHLYQLLAMAKEAGVANSFVHAIMDGRDTPPKSGAGYMKSLVDKMAEVGHGEVSTICGRYWAMDRDKRWERVQLAFDAFCRNPGAAAEADPVAAIEAKYAAEETDEFIKPVVCSAEGGIKDGDVVIFTNFRADRMREIAEAVGMEPPFETEFQRKDLHVATYTQYKDSFPMPCIFPPQVMNNVLGEWISKKGLKQFHVAETEKYAHVTFFFNGGQEKQFEGEVRSMVPSPKVATYDLQPEMNCAGVGDEMVKQIESGEFPFIMCNFAPPDMVGHTGQHDKAVIAVGATDEQLGRIEAACLANGYALFITSDHGNAEVMLTEDGKPVTSHTTNPVPFVCSANEVADGSMKFNRSEGTVADVAPTILTWMGLDVPPDMTGKSFF